MSAEVQREVRYAVTRMTPDELKYLAKLIDRMSEQVIFDPPGFLDTATVVSNFIAGRAS